ncbi:MAG: DNA polymerase III subunit delta, partial [Muribaculaceae bacterium]|nr:DNA polymerase III subunit delta [Muribaculaceae bacterium]
FELVAALSQRDFKRALAIVEYFRNNPKNNPYVVTTSTLFNFFSNLLVALYTPDKGDHSLMAACGYKWAGQLTDLRNAMRHYNAWHAIEIINAIRRYDAQSKGVDSRRDPFDLMQELILHILYPTGKIS